MRCASAPPSPSRLACGGRTARPPSPSTRACACSSRVSSGPRCSRTELTAPRKLKRRWGGFPPHLFKNQDGPVTSPKATKREEEMRFPVYAPEKLMRSSQTDRSYLAGIIDGEGTVSIASARDKRDNIKRQYISFQIGTCDLNLLFWIQGRFGGTIYEHSQNKKKNKKHRIAYVLQWSPKDFKFVFSCVYKYVKYKKPHLEILNLWITKTWSGAHGSKSHRLLTKDKKILREKLRNRLMSFNMKGRRPQAFQEAMN